MDLSRTGKLKRVSGMSRVADKKIGNPGMQLRRRTGMRERLHGHARELGVPVGIRPHTARAAAAGMPLAKIALALAVLLFASVGIFLGVAVYTKSRQFDVRIENGPIKITVTTTAGTVRELLEQNRVRVGPNDLVMPALNARLTPGLVVVVNRAITVFIRSQGQTRPLYMTGGTVEDALTRAKINYDADDEVSPKPDTVLTAGMRIRHVAVEKSVITELQNLKYDVVYKNSSSLAKGKTKVEQSGRLGIQQKTIEVLYKDGVEVSRTIVEDVLKQPPLARIILKGTGSTAPAGNSGGSNSGGSNASPDWNGSGIYSVHYRSVRRQDLVVPPVPSKFQSVIYLQLTAYTHTGRTTARGNWPQFTRTLKKPGTIAVDPKAIPYGTLLYVTGYGYCVAEDTGSNAVDSSRMGDLFMNTREECYKWGRRRNVAVYVIQQGYKR